MNAAPNDLKSETQRPDFDALGEAISLWFAISSPLAGPNYRSSRRVVFHLPNQLGTQTTKFSIKI